MVDEKLVDGLINLKKEDRNELTEELLSFMVENNIEMTQQEKSAMYQFARGYYNYNILYQVLNIIHNVDSEVISQVADKYLKLAVKPELKAAVADLAADWMRLPEIDRDAVKDDLLTFIVENNILMSAQEKSEVYLFARGNYSQNMLTQVIQIVNNADPTVICQLAEKYQSFIKPELKPELKAAPSVVPHPSAPLNLDGLFAQDLVADLITLPKDKREDVSEELISFIVDHEVQMTPLQKSAMDQFVKGHYSASILSQVLSIVNTVEPTLLDQLSERYQVKPYTTELAADFLGLEEVDRNALQEDLLDIVLENKMVLTQQQKGVLEQFARGHYSQNTLAQVFEIVKGADLGIVNHLADKYLKLVKTEQKPEAKMKIPILTAPTKLEDRNAHFKDLFAYDLVKDLANLPKGATEELREELILYIVEHGIQMNPQDKAAMNQFVKGHHNIPLLSQVIQIINKVEPTIVDQLSSKYLKLPVKQEFGLEFPTLLTPDLSQNFLSHTKTLRKEVTADLTEDLLSIFSKEELKALNLTHQENIDISKLAHGHTNSAALTNAIQVVLRVLEDRHVKSPMKRRAALRFGVELVPTIGLDKLVEFAHNLEVAGIDNLWMTDQYKNMDPYITLTMMAKATSIAGLGIGIANPFVLSPASMASAIASLNQVANNRMLLGLGAATNSNFTALTAGTSNTLNPLYETVQAFREFWSEPNPEVSILPKYNIPIYIGAQDMKMLEVAGEIGDGVLVNYSHEIDLGLAKQAILAGEKKVNKTSNDVDIAAYTCFSVSDDAKIAIKATIPIVAFIVAASPAEVLQRHDLNVEIASKLRGYLARGDMASAFRLVDAKFIDAFSISGTTQQCLNKIESLRKVGVNQFVFGSPLGPRKTQAIDLITEGILASYKS